MSYKISLDSFSDLQILSHSQAQSGLRFIMAKLYAAHSKLTHLYVWEGGGLPPAPQTHKEGIFIGQQYWLKGD